MRLEFHHRLSCLPARVSEASVQKRLRLAALFAALSLLEPAQAQRSLQVSVNPPQTTLSFTSTQTLRLNWDLNPAVTTTVRSTEGRLIDRRSGRVLDVIPTTLAVTAPGRIGETLVLNKERLADVVARGSGSLAYQRNWIAADGSQAVTQARIALVGSQYGGLEIRDVRLRFADGSDQKRVFEEGAAVAAYAEIAFTGRGGVLEYEWLLADPASTRTVPVFFRLGQRRTVVRSASPLRINAPPLPTLRSGPYLVQLRLREPDDVRLEPTLAYYVRPAAGGRPQPITLLAPTQGASLASGAEFSWRAVESASAYQLELFDQTREERLTGVLLPAGDSPSTPLTLIARQRLAAGCRCRWRVLAYDAEGELRGASDLHDVVVPPSAVDIGEQKRAADERVKP